tara:strand:- start:408 stop:863 length:456 start_codon:yes stop_codon:yes gene_type:complete
MYLTDRQYMSALKRMRDKIYSGQKLLLDRSNEMGCKFTSASWGMCIQEPGFWEPEERSFPETKPLYVGFKVTEEGERRDIFLESSKPKQESQMCPFDRQAFEGKQSDWPYVGCFNRCRLYKPDGPLDAEEAVILYDDRIKEFQEYLAQTLR